MTDRPAIARALIDLVVTMTRRKMPPQTSEVAAEVKRVLAEHETAPAMHITVSEIRDGEANDGELRSTDLFLKGRQISLLCNVEVGSQFTYSLVVDGQQVQSGSVGCETNARAEAAEARCAQLEEERDFQRARADKWVAMVETRDRELEHVQERLSELEAEHERLRAALDSVRAHCICGAALAPSQEPVK